MQPQTYTMLAEREDSYWWHRARRGMAVRLLSRCAVRRGGRWLDLGCGPGGNLRLSDAFAAALTVGVDLSPIALAIARRKKPEAQLVGADLNNALPFADGTFDVVTVFNVLYHDWIESEAKVLAEVRRVLRPGGVLLITEPAFAILAREMDVAAMGRRRYRIADIARRCDGAGLRRVQATYFTSFGFPLLLAAKLVRRTRRAAEGAAAAGADMKPLNPTVNNLLLWLATLESHAIAAKFPVPFGTTLLCLARKGQQRCC
jgi:SAM-dependent methyltransferase